MADQQNPLTGGQDENQSGVAGGTTSFSNLGEQNLRSFLSPKQQQVETGSQRAVEGAGTVLKQDTVESGSQRALQSVQANSSSLADELLADNSTQQLADEVRLNTRRESGDYLGSLQTGAVTVAEQIANIPSGFDLYGRLSSLSETERQAVNEVRTYEAVTKTLDNKIAEIVNNTELDPFRREVLRGALQQERNNTVRPDAAYQIYDSNRILERNPDDGLGSAALAAGGITEQMKQETLRDFMKEIDIEYRDLAQNRAFFDQYKGDVDPINQQDLVAANKVNTEAGLAQASKGVEAFQNGEYAEGAGDVIIGSMKALGGSLEAAYNNPQGLGEMLAQTAPQLAAALNPYTRGLTNLAYGQDVFNEAVEEYKKDNEGKLPGEDELTRMATSAMGAALLEVAADKVLVGGTGTAAAKVKDGIDPAIRAIAKSAFNNKYTSNAATRIAGRVTESAITEGATEAGQTALEANAKGDEVDGADVSLSAVVGAAAGSGFSGGIQTAVETTAGAKTAATAAKKKASDVAQKVAPSKEESLVSKADRQARKGGTRDAKQTNTARDAVNAVKNQEALVELLRRSEATPESTLKAQEEKLNRLKAKSKNLEAQTANSDRINELASSEEATADDLLGEVSFQLAQDDDGKNISVESLETAREAAVAKGATEKQIANLDKVIEAKKTSAEVRDDIIIGSPDWRGGGTYINNIIQAMESENYATADFNLVELARFSGYMDQKLKDFEAALEESEATGRSVEVKKTLGDISGDFDGESGLYYESLDGGRMFVNPVQSKQLIEDIRNDAGILSKLVIDAMEIYTEEDGATRSASEVLAQYLPDTQAAPDLGEVNTNAETETESTEDVEQGTGDSVEPSESPVSEGTEVDTTPTDSAAEANVEKVAQDVEPLASKVRSPEEINELPDREDVFTRASSLTTSANTKRALSEINRYFANKQDGTGYELNPSIPEAHYAKAQELIERAIAEPDAGTAKTKGRGEKTLENMPNSYVPEKGPKNASEADLQFLESNEFTQEAKISGYIADNPSPIQNIYERGAELGIAQERIQSLHAALGKYMLPLGRAVAAEYKNRVADVIEKKGDNRFTKLNTKWLSNFRDSNGHLVSFMRLATPIVMMEYINDNLGRKVTDQQIRTLANLDSKAAIPAKLYALAAEINIGDSRDRIVEALGQNIMKTAGVRFDGAHANTEDRHTSSIGRLAFDTLLNMGILKEERVSVNKLIHAGADLDNTVLINALGAVEVNSWPGNRYQGDYISYGDNNVVYEYVKRGNRGYYRVYDNVTNPVATIATYTFNEDGFDFDTFKDDMSGLSSVMSKVFETNREGTIPAMVAPRKNNGNIKGHAEKRMNKKQVAAQNNQSEQALFLNRDILSLLAVLPVDALQRIAGYVTIPETTNVVKRLSMEGKNQTIENDLVGFNKFVEDMEAEGEIIGERDIANIPFFANFFNSAYQRQFVDSQSFNYQSSKSMHRFMAHHGGEIMDMTKNEDVIKFKVAVAQGLGVKVDKLSSMTSIADLNKEIEKFQPEIDAVGQLLNGIDPEPEMMDSIIEVAASEENMHTFLALIEYAKFQQAFEEGKTKLEVVMPVELDGVNNGPITAILQAMTDNAEDFMSLAGIQDAANSTESNASRYEREKDGLYERGASALGVAVNSHSTSLSETKDSSPAYWAFESQTALKKLSGRTLREKDGVLEVDRNETKGIITQMFYGAGDSSLLRSEASDMIDGIYDAVQALIDGKPSAMNAKTLATKIAMAGTPIASTKFNEEFVSLQEWKSNLITNRDAILAQWSQDNGLVEFNLQDQFPEVYSGIFSNMNDKSSYGYVKVDAIKGEFNGAVLQGRTIAKMTSLAALYSKVILEEEEAALREALELSEYEDLPVKEKQDMYKRLGKYMPNLSLDMHTDKEHYTDAIPLYKFERGQTDKAAVAQYGLTTDGKAENNNTVHIAPKQFTDVGVGGVPASTISVADASVIMGIMQRLNRGFMTVFDGVLINGMSQDVLRDAANEAYAQSLRKNDTFELILSNLKDIVNYGGTTGQGVNLSYEQSQELFKITNDMGVDEFLTYLDTFAASLIKNEALDKDNLAVDQFGSIDGEITVVDKNNKAVAYEDSSVVNDPRQMYTDSSDTNGADTGDVTKINSTVLAGAIESKWGKPAPVKNKGGVTRRLRTLLTATELPESAYRDFLSDGLIAKVLAPAFAALGEVPSIKVVSDTEMAALSGGKPAKGAYVHEANTIYLNSDRNGVNAETLFHELVHAALDYQIVINGRTDKAFAENLSKLALEAEKALQENAEWEGRFRNFKPWIRKDGSVNTREFVSWGLTNFDIMTELLQTRTEQVEANRSWLQGLYNTIRKLVNKFFGKDNVSEDAVFSYLFASAAKLAEGVQVPKKKQKGVSLQQHYTDIQNEEAAATFDRMESYSHDSAEHTKYLRNVFINDIEPWLSDVKYDFADTLSNSIERITELQNSDININPSQMLFQFNMSPLEIHVYEMYQKVIEAGLEDFDVNTKELTALYQQAKKQLTPADFLLDGQSESDVVAMAVAQDKYDAVFESANRTRKDPELTVSAAGIRNNNIKSNYLANFAALARTSSEFRAVMDRGFSRSNETALNRNLDNIDLKAIEVVQEVVGKIVDISTGARGTGTERVDKLSGNIAAAQQRSKYYLEGKARMINEAKDKAYAKYSELFDGMLRSFFGLTPIAKAGSLLKGAAKKAFDQDYWADKGKADIWDEAFYQLHYGYFSFLPRLVQEMRPTDSTNKFVRRLSITKTKAIAGARDGLTKATHSAVDDAIGTLTDNQYSALTDIVLDSDLSALRAAGLSDADIIALLRNEDALDNEIAAIEDDLLANAGNHAHYLIRSAYSLGTLISHGQPSEGFTQVNASNIVEHANLSHKYGKLDNYTAYENRVDALATLVAIKNQNEGSRRTVADLMQTKPEGVSKLIQMHRVFKEKQITQAYRGDKSKMLKGFSHETYDGFKDIRFVQKDEKNELLGSNYTLLGTIDKDPADKNPDTIYVVGSSTGGLGTYQQGVYSTINSSLSGVDNLDNRVVTNGYDDYKRMSKWSPATVAAKHAVNQEMFENKPGSRTPKSLMIPVVNTDNNGRVTVEFKYTLPRVKREQYLGRDKNFRTLFGHAMGRTVEATQSDQFNNQVNRALKDTYEADKARGNLNGYIEISRNAPTRRGREAYRMMPPAARKNLQETWGPAAHIRSDLFDTVYGYRKASLANVFRKNEDNPQWVKGLAKAITRNYKHEGKIVGSILRVEKGLGEFSGFIKDLIVIRGMQVMLGNMMSNTVQLALQEDMSIVRAIKYQIEGIRHARTYQENQTKIRRIEFDLNTGALTEAEAKKARNMRAELRDQNDRNPVKPLIEEGLLTAIVEDVESNNDPFSYGNRIGSWVTGATSKMPTAAKWVGEIGLASKESDVYKTLYMFTQLGDFSSRYAMYKNRQDKGEAPTPELVDEVVDAFVNYDLPSNKYMQYLGDVGQLWFFKYFFRIQQVIIRNTIKNPRKVFELFALSNITGLNITSYFDAFFLFNSITNKMGFMNYTEMGLTSIPGVQVYDFVAN